MEAAAATLAANAGRPPPATGAKRPPVYDYFDLVRTGKHIVEKTGQELPCEWWVCKKKALGTCKAGSKDELCKVVQKATGGLFKHLKKCEGIETWMRVRGESPGSRVCTTADGQLVEKMDFADLLPHHVRFVIFCVKTWEKFSKSRNADFVAYVEGWEMRARLPHHNTCIKILFLIKLMVERRLNHLLGLVKKMLGSPFCGLLDDVWSKRNCKQSFACARIPLAIDGELLDEFRASLGVQGTKYTGTIVSCSPVLAFSTLPSSRHTGHVLARWKRNTLEATKVLEIRDISLATEDGASNNKKSNKILRLPSKVCAPHDLQRCVLYAMGLTGKPSQNPSLRDFQAKSSKMVGSFSKSGVATAALIDAQQKDEDWNKVLSLASPNATRWLGLHRQAMRNRELQPNIATALCGDAKGKEDELDDEGEADSLSESGSSCSGDENEKGAVSDDDDLVESQVRKGMPFPLRHRLLTNDEFSLNRQLESVLTSPAEVSALMQSHDGCRLEEAHLHLLTLTLQMAAPRLQVVSGRGESESWDEIPAARLQPMIRDFRTIFFEQANTRFRVMGTPDEHVLLCLKMSPFVDTTSTSTGPFGKRATQELMMAVYRTKLRQRQLYMNSMARGIGDRESTSETATPSVAVTPTTFEAAPWTTLSGLAGTSAVPPGPRKRQRIGELSATMHLAKSQQAATDELAAMKALDNEVDRYSSIAASLDVSKYRDVKTGQFDLNRFWADHKTMLPIHYRVYLGDCGSKRAASASVETVYSGATKFSSESSDRLDDTVLAAYVFLHVNLQFEFLVPTVAEIVAEYKRVYGSLPPPEELDDDEEEAGAAAAEAPAVAPAAAVAAAADAHHTATPATATAATAATAAATAATAATAAEAAEAEGTSPADIGAAARAAALAALQGGADPAAAAAAAAAAIAEA